MHVCIYIVAYVIYGMFGVQYMLYTLDVYLVYVACILPCVYGSMYGMYLHIVAYVVHGMFGV